jgi:predicted DNA-binding transcriptional regulator AlpA
MDARISSKKHYETQLDPNALYRLRQVLNFIPVSASSWWAGIHKGIYPKGIKLTERTTVWRGRDLLELIERASHGRTTITADGVARRPIVDA